MKHNDYRMRKNSTVTENGHIMRATGEDVKEIMTRDSHVVNVEVDDKARNKSLSSGDTKKKMATRRCFDNTKDFRTRIMSNIGEIVVLGTTIDTSRASDGEYKNGKCVTASEKRIKLIKSKKLIKIPRRAYLATFKVLIKRKMTFPFF